MTTLFGLGVLRMRTAKLSMGVLVGKKMKMPDFGILRYFNIKIESIRLTHS